MTKNQNVPIMGPHHFRCLIFTKATASPQKLRSLPSNATLILDLEDSIPAEQKSQQRQRIQKLFETGIFRDRTVVLRINGPDQPSEMHADIISCLHKDLDGIIVPMIQNREEMVSLEDMIQRREKWLDLPKKISLIPLIERPGAVLHLEEILCSSPRICAVAFGHVDYCVEMHSEIHEDCYGDAQMKVLQAARACQISAVATVHLDLKSTVGFENQNIKMKKYGFDGCFALNPKQAELALKIFTPTMEEIAYSKRVLDACREQGHIAILDGEMIGPPMVKIAQRILQQYALENLEVA